MRREILPHIHSYGLMLCIAFILAMFITYRHLKKYFIDPYVVFDLIIAALIGGILGARIFYIIGNWKEFSGHFWEVFKFWNVEGLVFYGGLIFGALAVILVIRIKGLPLWIIADAAGFSLALGLGVTRIGCFLNGCCFGKPTSLPWGVTFPASTRLVMGMPWDTPIHPTQIYEMLLDILIFIILIVIYKKLKYHGEVFFIFLALYGLDRFFVEFFRYHKAYGQLTFQVMSLALTLGALIFLNFRSRILPEVRL